MKPILMNTEMVKAILANRKTVTRRLIKRVLPDWDFVELRNDPNKLWLRQDGKMYTLTAKGLYALFSTGFVVYRDFIMVKAPYRPNDVLYVREAWGHGYYDGEYIYKASDKLADLPNFQDSTKMLYRPSIHMPKEAARIFLRVTNVRVERLKEITITELIHDFNICKYAIEAVGFEATAESVWNSTIKKSDLGEYGWEANPWVWVIDFERISKEEALEHDKR